MVVREDARNRINLSIRWPFEGNAGRFIQRDEVDLAPDAVHQTDQPSRILLRFVESPEQHVLVCDAIAMIQRKPATGLEDVFEAVLAVDGHQKIALVFCRGVQ
jgi:hypothetical protein